MSSHVLSTSSPSTGHRTGFVSFLSAVAVATASVLAFGPSSVSASAIVSQATGDFLTGTVGGTNLATLVQLQGATATNTGSPATVQDVHPLDVTALSAINVPLGTGINLLGGNGLVDLGAANQYAVAHNDGASYGASGAVTDQGAVAVGGANPGPQGSTSVNLNPLLSGAGLTGVISNATLGIGALAATADQPAPGTSPAPTGTYRIAGVGLNLTTPLVASTIGPILNLLVTTNCTTPPCVAQLTAPGVVIDLTSGQITLDVSALLPTLDGAMAPNTPVLPALVSALTTALSSVQLSVGGTNVPLGALTGPLGTALNGIVGQLSTALNGVLNLTANVQVPTPPAAGQKFTETALVLGLLATSTTSAATVNLASASVGPNSGPAAPTSASIHPDQGPTSGGQTVTITGTNFIPGATTVTIGGITIPANQVTVAPSATSLTFVTPPHAAGPVSVSVTTAGGTAPPLAYTYVPPPTASSINPSSGPDTGGQTVTVTGTGFVPGATTVTIGGITVPANQVSVASDGNSLTFTTPPHTVGTVNVTATTPGGTSPPLAYTYVPSAPTITTPANGSTVAGTTPIAGNGAPGDTVTVTEAGNVLCTAVVNANGHWTCTPATPLSEGSHTITATQKAPTGETSAPSAPDNFTVIGAPTATSLTPTSGPETGGTTVTITGTNFVPGHTTVTICGITVPASGVTVSADGKSLTFVTPAHIPATCDVTVTAPGGTSTALTFTYVPVPPVITSPGDGTTTGGQPPISGSGTPGDTVTVTDGNGNTVCTAVVDSTGHWMCTPGSSLPGGPNTVTATQTAAGGFTSGPSAPVHFTVETLAATGASPGQQILIGLLTVLIGAGFVGLSRRRRARTA